MVLSLHGCDTLTDEAIRIAAECKADYIFVAPCCQHEMRYLWNDHPLSWISRYGLLEQRLADTLTDGFRSLALEALGYRVNVIRFTELDITPKNLIIQAVKATKPDPNAKESLKRFMNEFGVHPKLAEYIKNKAQ